MAELPTPIIAPEILREHLSSPIRILDCRSGPDAAARYAESHIHGALHIDLEGDLSGDRSHPDRGGRHPLPPIATWAATLGRLGIDETTFVVLYDDKNGSNAAARAWWMVRAVGHRSVAVLDGGLAAARAAGVPFDAEPVEVQPKPPYPVREWKLPTLEIDEVDRIRHENEWRLIDVRAPERYRGESEPFDPLAGHIPGAQNLPLTDNLEPDGRFLSPDALRALFLSRLDGVPPERLVVSCGSGVTACHTLLALEHAGLSGAALYVGSWSEWCRSGRDLARGPERG